jgi:predicted nucleic acid-binding protein
MTQKIPRIFLDTSVIIAAVFSPSGGARQVFYLGEIGVLDLIVGPNVIREADDVVRRKAPGSLPLLAQLLVAGRLKTSKIPTKKQIENAQSYLLYKPDTYVLAEAMAAQPDWFITYDKEHFLDKRSNFHLGFEIGTPGDLILAIKEAYRSP